MLAAASRGRGRAGGSKAASSIFLNSQRSLTANGCSRSSPGQGRRRRHYSCRPIDAWRKSIRSSSSSSSSGSSDSSRHFSSSPTSSSSTSYPASSASSASSWSSSSSSSSSVDATEVSHFNALASTWWDIRGPSRLLHLMNPLRHDFIASCLSSSYSAPPSPSSAAHDVDSDALDTSSTSGTDRRIRYLDVGCGGGIFAESAARLPHTELVVGIDPSKEVIAVARQHARRDPLLQQPIQSYQSDQSHHYHHGYHHHNYQPPLSSSPSPSYPSHDAGPLRRLTYINTPIETLLLHLPPLPSTSTTSLQQSPSQSSPASSPFSSSSSLVAPEQQFDVLTLFEVLEHVAHPAAFLAACAPWVRPGGWLVLSTIARSRTSWLTTKLVAERVARIVPPGTHDWAKYINPDELAAWFAAQRQRSAGGDGTLSHQKEESSGGDSGSGSSGGGGRSVWGRTRVQGVVYVPGFGWQRVRGSERLGNYFFGVRKNL